MATDLETMLVDALQASKEVCRAWTVRTYVGGARTISAREPNDDTFWYSSINSWDYVRVAVVSNATALRHLRKLVDAGKMEKVDRVSNIPRFRMIRKYHDAICASVIAELVAEGLPFDDDWCRAREVARG